MTSYRRLQVKFDWILKDWRCAPEYLRNKTDNEATSIRSPPFPNSLGSSWQLSVVFENDKDQVRFKCYCLKPPPFDASKEFPEARGSLTLSNEDDKEINRYFLNEGCKLTASPVFDTETWKASSLPDCVIFCADLSLIGFEGNSERSLADHSKVCVGRCLSQMAADRDFCDLVIEVEGQKISAHRVVLAARSPVLRALLSADMREKREARIVLTDASASAWRLFQDFLYTDTVPESMNDLSVLLETLALGEKYDVSELKTCLQAYILRRLKPDNVVEIGELAAKLNMADLKVAAGDFIQDNWKSVKAEKGLLTWLAGGSDMASEIFKKLHF